MLIATATTEIDSGVVAVTATSTVGAAGAVTPTSHGEAGSPGDRLIAVMLDAKATFSPSPCLW